MRRNLNLSAYSERPQKGTMNKKKIFEKIPQESGVMTPCPVGGVITLCL